MSNIPHRFHLGTLRSLWLMDCADISAAPRTHSPFSSPDRIASTHAARPECGYGKMDIHGGEGAAIITSFRAVRLCTMGIFPSGAVAVVGELGLFKIWSNYPFIRSKLNVSNSLHNSAFLHFVKPESVMWPVPCATSVWWRCNESQLFFSPFRLPMT